MNLPCVFDRPICYFLRTLKILAICAALLVVDCSKNVKTTADPQKMIAEVKAFRSPPECPGALASQPTGHKVLLTWNVSKSSSGPDDKSIGYCIYRSDHPIVADTIEGCKDCQKITPTAIFGAGCVDDFGSDPNAYYYYAAIAIGSDGQRSKFSNKTRSKLSKKPLSFQSGSNQTYPACRPPGTLKPASAAGPTSPAN
jgi:hypothetical protein